MRRVSDGVEIIGTSYRFAMPAMLALKVSMGLAVKPSGRSDAGLMFRL
jgi:hypothetical protein